MLRNKTVLVLESDPSLRSFIFSVLSEQLNCKRVSLANSKQEALEIVKSLQRKDSIDLIIGNWETTKDDGIEFLEKVKSSPELLDVPFILTTSREDMDSINRAKTAGISGCLIKPYSAAMLLRKINRAVKHDDRRSMKRFSVFEDVKVEIRFKNLKTYEGRLRNISQTGCLLTCPLFKHGIQGLYDPVAISFQFIGMEVQVGAEIARIAEDLDVSTPRQFMNVGFQFTKMDANAGEKIRKVIASLPLESEEES